MRSVSHLRLGMCFIRQHCSSHVDSSFAVHVTERHAVENMGFLALSSVIFDILRGVSFALTISFPLVTDALGSMFNAMNDVVAERAYSRKLETEADTLGLMVSENCRATGSDRS